MAKSKLSMRMCLYEKIFGHNNGLKGLRTFWKIIAVYH